MTGVQTCALPICIGIGRILSGVIELNHDKDGMVLPPSIAPFELIVTPGSDMYEARCRRCFEPGIPKQVEMDFIKAKVREPKS